MQKSEKHNSFVVQSHFAALVVIATLGCSALQERVVLAQQTQSSNGTIAPIDIARFLPENAKFGDKLAVHFKNGAEPDAIVLTYTLPSERDPYYFAGLRIVRHDSVSGWAVVYEENNQMGPGVDELTIKKVKGEGGQEGVVAIYYYSGAGTTTYWKVIALVNGKFTALNSAPIRDRVLKKRQLIFMGYNGVVVKDDLIVETVPGHTRGAAACCPDRPSIEIAVKFSGDSMKLDSVKALPDMPPTK